MLRVGDIVRVGNDTDERQILSVYKTSDDRVFCGVGGFLRYFESYELTLVRQSTISHPYELGQRVYYKRGQAEDEVIVCGIELSYGYNDVPRVRYNLYHPCTDTVTHMVRQEKLRPLESYTLF